MSLLVAGDNAVVGTARELILTSSRGPLQRWPLPPDAARAGDDDDDNGDGAGGASGAGARAGAVYGSSFADCAVSHAALASPPRLAVLVGAGEVDARSYEPHTVLHEARVDFVDVATGETQASTPLASPARAGTEELRGARVIGFSSDGANLLVDDGAGLVVLDAAGSFVRRFDGLHVDIVRFARDGRSLACRVLRQARMARIDLDSGETRVFAAAVGDVVADPALERAAVIESERGVQMASIRDLVNGERVHTFEVRRPSLVRLYADAQLREVSALDAAGLLVTYRREGGPARRVNLGFSRELWDPVNVHVDVARDRVLYVARGAARLRTLDGKRLALYAGSRALFAGGGGAAVVLTGGALRVLDSGTPEALPGPGRILSVVAHPRGVLALDDTERAHVIEP